MRTLSNLFIVSIFSVLSACTLLVEVKDKPTNNGNGTCGDGVKNGTEACDEEDLGDQTCGSLGFDPTDGGVLTCNANCTFDTSGCGGSVCGNGILEEGEACDDEQLGGATCVTLGYTGGLLACNGECQFDVSECAGGFCGNGYIDAGEACDGENLNGFTCESLGLGFVEGDLRCADDCTFNTSQCEGAETETICDDGADNDNDGKTDCADPDCLNEDHCGAEEFDCHDDNDNDGDGMIDCEDPECANEPMCMIDNEICNNGVDDDGDGSIDCWDSGCMGHPGCSMGTCGDGTVNYPSGEQCDGANFDGEDCISLGYMGGTLNCFQFTCQFDVSGCIGNGVCGNGIIETPEESCEGANLNGKDCFTMGFAGGGTLTCGTDCQYIVSGCTHNLSSTFIGNLVYVPGGTFLRDTDPSNLSTVSSFYMSQYEITRTHWTSVTGWPDPSDVSRSSGPGDPVQMVSWYDAIAFCNKLSLQEGLTPVYSISGVNFQTLTYAQIPTADDVNWNAVTADWGANGYRLPTEMEWLWAAMGGDTADPGNVNTDGFMKLFAGHSGTNTIGDCAVFGFYSSEPGRTMTERTNPVGSRCANELGIYDLSGNVWEWIWDWKQDSFPTGDLTNYRGPGVPGPGGGRVGRGGSWENSSPSCALNDRGVGMPNIRYFNFGFHVVRK